uniref:ABC transporter ATP-binding protein n=1 Tax=Candidatus Fimenecus sp. TaxID=3022888 RepID=UPI004028D7B7
MLKVANLCKRFDEFSLDNVSFEVPEGMIVGFIGQNGAGKTTTLKCIMRTVQPDSGKVVVFGRDMAETEKESKQLISFTTGAFDYYPNDTLKKIADVYATFYDEWSKTDFDNYCRRFNLVLTKKVRELSAGMKVKFALALAMSHNAKLFIFDEPTSGLDPIARDELLDVFRDIVDDGDKSILFSTHITSDLEKCADIILFIKDGRILLEEGKDELLEEHVIVKGGTEQLTNDLKSRLVAVKTHQFGFTALMRRCDLKATDNLTQEKPTLDDIMVYYNKKGALTC